MKVASEVLNDIVNKMAELQQDALKIRNDYIDEDCEYLDLELIIKEFNKDGFYGANYGKK